jgi:hypothetical protein
MMKHLLVLTCLLLTASLFGQDVEHAPTVAQCQADQRLWLSKLEADPPDTNLPSFDALSLWESEMGDCGEVDNPNYWKYYNTREEASEVQEHRLINFLDRHHLYAQFRAENAAGKR